MVEFGTGYYMPMDRAYDKPSPSENSTNDVGVSIGDLGMSMALGPVPNIPTVAARMRGGAKTVELGFMGAGKGSGQGHTPEMYGELQRQALREMQKANEYNFTTHATVGVMGLAGMDQQGNFSKQSKDFGISEIKRAIEFAADVSRGGPVVVHTGEFQRPLVDAEWNKDNRFKLYDGEEERATFRVVDDRTGGIIQEARKNRKVSRPIWLRYEEETGGKIWEEHGGSGYADDKGNQVKQGDYIDYWGNKIERAVRVPVYKGGRFVTRQLDWQDLREEAVEMTEEAQSVYKKWLNKEISQAELDESIWSERVRKAQQQGTPINEFQVKPEEAYIIATLETNAANSRGWAHYYGGQFDEYIDDLKKLRKAKEVYVKIESETDPDEQWRLKKQAEGLAGGLVPTDAKLPTELIDKHINHIERQMKQNQEGSASQWAQAEEAMETIRHVQSAEGYALGESFDSYAEAGLNAMMHSNKLEKQGQLKKPIAIAMENLFPESYGAHPDELITLVEGSRKRMQQLLEQRGYSEQQAKKEAGEHINATFDTGHFNMWRKYWRGDQDKTIEQNDKDFEKWALKKVEELAEKGVVGHLHIVDNYGYQDDHLAPGEGNTPIKKMVEIFKKHGFKGDMVVEPGADYTTDTSGFQTMTKAWKLFGSPVYGIAGNAAPDGRQWGQVQYGWFGQNRPPYFTFGGYSPSEEWTLWSGVPLE